MSKQYHVFAFDQFTDEAIVEELVFSTNTEKQAESFIGKEKNYNLSYKIRHAELIEGEDGDYDLIY